MPGIIAALRDAANPFSILTKGTLILREPGPAGRGGRGHRRRAEPVGRIRRPGALPVGRAWHAEPAAAAGGLRHHHRPRPAVRRADGARTAVPVRLPQPAGGYRPADRRGRRRRMSARSCCTCGRAPASGTCAGRRAAPELLPATAGCTGRGRTRPAPTSGTSPSKCGNWPGGTASAGPARPAVRRLPPSRQPGPSGPGRGQPGRSAVDAVTGRADRQACRRPGKESRRPGRLRSGCRDPAGRPLPGWSIARRAHDDHAQVIPGLGQPGGGGGIEAPTPAHCAR